MKEHHDNCRSCDEVWIPLQVEGHFELFDDASFFVSPSTINEEQIPVIEKEMNSQEK